METTNPWENPIPECHRYIILSIKFLIIFRKIQILPVITFLCILIFTSLINIIYFYLPLFWLGVLPFPEIVTLADYVTDWPVCCSILQLMHLPFFSSWLGLTTKNVHVGFVFKTLWHYFMTKALLGHISIQYYFFIQILCQLFKCGLNKVSVNLCALRKIDEWYFIKCFISLLIYTKKFVLYLKHDSFSIWANRDVLGFPIHMTKCPNKYMSK